MITADSDNNSTSSSSSNGSQSSDDDSEKSEYIDVGKKKGETEKEIERMEKTVDVL